MEERPEITSTLQNTRDKKLEIDENAPKHGGKRQLARKSGKLASKSTKLASKIAKLARKAAKLASKSAKLARKAPKL
ncbi:hypothetical protein [Peribacillus sp. SI8-4]|uniref:hypothetical protein n=1 Tax=Peribacillus sp. SI8-4 TaxID=3048009 RepID=UPI0025542E18|nr:hypothetical protein [Peribacillus sp. SI8-4]